MAQLKEPEKVRSLLASYTNQIPFTGSSVYARDAGGDHVLIITKMKDRKGLGRPKTQIGLIPSFGISLHGVIGGYTRHAETVVALLHTAGQITDSDFDAWHAWYMNEAAKNASASEIEKMKELASKHGFLVEKGPASSGPARKKKVSLDCHLDKKSI